MYNYGSEARNLEYAEGFTGRDVSADNESKRQAQMEMKLEKLKRKALKSLAVIAALLAVVMVREAQIDKLCGEITKKENSIHNLNALIVEKEAQLSGKMDINMIEEAAQERLGMIKPVNEQYVSIKLDKHDGGEVLTRESTQSSSFAATINKAKNLLEYLY